MAWTEERKGLHVGYYRAPGSSKKIRAGSDKNKKKALKLAQDEEAKIRFGTWQDPNAGSMTFATYFHDHWLPNKLVQPNTIDNYLSAYQRYIGPTFGDVPVNKITMPRVQRWVIAMDMDGVTPSNLKAKFDILYTVLGGHKGVSAVRDGLIRVNPCVDVTLPATDQGDVQVYEVEEVDRLMQALPEWWRPLPIFLTETGLRFNEMAGLLISDFEACGWGETELIVDRQVEYVSPRVAKLRNLEPGLRHKDRTKSTRRRKITLTEDAVTLVQRLMVERELFPMDRVFSIEDRANKGKPKRDERWPIGVPIARPSFNYHWRRVHIETGIHYRKIHALRASNLTWMLNGGADIGVVQRQAGHARVLTTQKYLGAMKNDANDVREALEATKRRSRGA